MSAPDRPRCPHSVDAPDYPGGTRNLVGFLIESGVSVSDAYALDCPDVHTMVRTLAGANYAARTERRLVAETLKPSPARASRLPAVLLSLVLALATVALLLICTPVWRTFS